MILSICLTLVATIFTRLTESLVHPDVYEALSGNHSKVDIIISLHEVHCPTRALTAIRSHLNDLSHVHERASLVKRHLEDHASTTQANVITYLHSLSIYEFSTLWITNQILVKQVPLGVIELLHQHDDVYHIQHDMMIVDVSSEKKKKNDDTERYRRQLWTQNRLSKQDRPTEAELWGPRSIKTAAVHAQGYRGAGMILGVIDSGLHPFHEEFRNTRILAWKDVTNDTDRGRVYDDLTHGTHVTAIALGQDIGVAPDADVVVCKGIKSSGFIHSSIAACGQWMICPNDRCQDTPHVINNSWTVFFRKDARLLLMLEHWRAVGILPVFSTGNNFNRPYVCADLEANFPSLDTRVISVGATTPEGYVAGFSRRHYHRVDEDTTEDVTILAPGQDIWSASNVHYRGYVRLSGTSMAAPFVSGALLILQSLAIERCSRVLTLSEMKQLLQRSSIQVLDDEQHQQVCDGLSKRVVGQLDLERATQDLRCDVSFDDNGAIIREEDESDGAWSCHVHLSSSMVIVLGIGFVGVWVVLT